MFLWSLKTRVWQRLIQPAKPTQKGFVESCNGSFRDDCLNKHQPCRISPPHRDLAHRYTLSPIRLWLAPSIVATAHENMVPS